MQQRRKLEGESVGKTRFISSFLLVFFYLTAAFDFKLIRLQIYSIIKIVASHENKPDRRSKRDNRVGWVNQVLI